MASAPPDPFLSRASLEVDLDALCANYRMLANAAPGAQTAAVVKCDAYGLGLRPVARALAARAGCQTFFVTYPHEGAALRAALSEAAPDADIFVFNGPDTQNIAFFKQHALTPVLNSFAQAALWARAPQDARPAGGRAALHADTGMNRLGAPESELAAIAALDLDIDLVISHLACASDPDNAMNERQRRAFEKAAAIFPGARRCLAASGGALLGSIFHYDMIRPGVALYGVGPFDAPDPRLRPGATLSAPVIQIRRVNPGETTGYSATKRFEKPADLATVALGYGDGFPRAASNQGRAFLGGGLCPIVGRVSMDLITLDVTNAPEPVEIGDRAEFFGPHLPIENAAAACGTIGYELLAGLGARLARRYVSNGVPLSNGAGAVGSG